MFAPASPEFVAALNRFAFQIGLKPAVAAMAADEQPAPAIENPNLLVVMVRVDDKISLEAISEELRVRRRPFMDESKAYELLVVLENRPLKQPRLPIERGIALTSGHDLIAQLVGLPTGWKDAQQSLISHSLEPVTINGRIEMAKLIATVPDGNVDALGWLSQQAAAWPDTDRRMLYLKAEAGKGKSTILAALVRNQLLAGSGPLPIYVPLRLLQRGAGISWDALVSPLGVIGDAASRLAKAVGAGLVSLALDGLDEVSGRYDQTIVRSVLDVIRRDVWKPKAFVLLSGRTTEASLLQEAEASEITIALPPSNDPEFQRYAQLVAKSAAEAWPSVARRVPEPPLPVENLRNEALTPADLRQLVAWISWVFDDLGKEQSLFFVQSLACLGRTIQLTTNEPLLITSRDQPALEMPLINVCLLAAALACIREQDKIESIAQEYFRPGQQLAVMSWLALKASSEANLNSQMPTPNELAQRIFNIDPINQNEEFTAVLRQLQKHALLFAVGGEGARVGDWRPAFLSEWVRNALLCRTWHQRHQMIEGSKALPLEPAIARAARAEIAYRYLLPELARVEKLPDLTDLVTSLCNEADQESPEACANYWGLACHLDEETRLDIQRRPQSIVPMSDLSDLEIDSVEFDGTFSSNLAFYVEADIRNCVFKGVAFTQCDFTNAVFASCSFDDCSFSNCDGPILFDDCQFRKCRIENGRSKTVPAIRFVGCDFRESRLAQNRAPTGGDRYEPAFAFDACTSDVIGGELLSGDWLGTSPDHVSGIDTDDSRTTDPALETLRRLLSRFFPLSAGGAHRQARGYIRSSSISRGVWPAGAPDGQELIDVLMKEGFTTGGRTAHIYAPWSQVAGGREEDVRFRNECLAFLQSGDLSDSIRGMCDRIRQLMN